MWPLPGTILSPIGLLQPLLFRLPPVNPVLLSSVIEHSPQYYPQKYVLYDTGEGLQAELSSMSKGRMEEEDDTWYVLCVSAYQALEGGRGRFSVSGVFELHFSSAARGGYASEL